jgi:heat shock protein HtpX
MNSFIKTILLLGVLSVILITIGRLIGGVSGMYTALFFALISNGIAYFYSDKIALKMNGAKPLTQSQNPQLYKMVQELSHRLTIPMPKLYITPAKQANAFATGRDPNHASVAVTAGILDVLSPEELRGVLAHELGHVKNRDILIVTIAAVLASTLSFMGNMAMWNSYSRDEENNGGIIALVAAILVPIAAGLIQMAISRQREFAADELGAQTIGNGNPLADALLEISSTTKRLPLKTNPAFSSLYIENPFGGSGSRLLNLFSTHPPVEERVRRLRAIKK